MSAIALEDKDMNGKFGLPSCALLVEKVNQQGKRKRLAEAVKGVCSILGLPRAVKHVLATEKMRFNFTKLVCGTDRLVSSLPPEEMQKMVHYLQMIFSPFRSKHYYQPRPTPSIQASHESCLKYALDILAEGNTAVESNESSEGKEVHWRKLLLATWFILTMVDGEDAKHAELCSRTWTTCFYLLENETGQPLQRVALGLLGRLTSLVGPKGDIAMLREKMVTAPFCKALGQALAFDHREDRSIGGGHDAQWSTGVEDILRDAARNVAPRNLFPFQRTSQSSGSFKVSHAQIVELILSRLDEDAASTATKYLLSSSVEMAGAPPSEDQRNQQVASAEIFAGVCGAYFRRVGKASTSAWEDIFLPHLDDVMAKIPFSLCGAFFDAIRYAIQFSRPQSFFPLTSWVVEKIEATLWQPTENGESNGVQAGNGSTHGTEGFSIQSKWLYLFSAVLIEVDEKDIDSGDTRGNWYYSGLVAKGAPTDVTTSLSTETELEKTWELVTDRLLPRLSVALGHPFDSCRDHISRCLFRICYIHRKRVRIGASRGESPLSTDNPQGDPGSIVVAKLSSLEKPDGWSFNNRYNALSTARRFVSYCVHLGEAKYEYSEYVVPLLPLIFEALKSTVEDEIRDSPESTTEENAAKRALEADVIKNYRYMIAELSTTAIISYGRDEDITRVLDVVENAYKSSSWQVRHASANFLRCFQGAHKFLFATQHANKTMKIVTELLADERREVSSAAMAALTGILAASPVSFVAKKVKQYALTAGRSKMKKVKKSIGSEPTVSEEETEAQLAKEILRTRNQQTSVFFLCAAVMAQPYETPQYVPVALAAISKHSFERNAPLGVRDTVKKCCAEYKKMHMSDNWELHRSVFTQEQLESLEDVVSSPHYYA
jgi:proteasome activator subunit 4